MPEPVKWQELERYIRLLAESIWGVEAKAEIIESVRCDAVLRLKKDHFILIEISKERTLQKIRIDQSKFLLMKTALIAKGIYSECYFITEEVHESIKEYGKSNNIEVHSVKSFTNSFIGSERYINERSRQYFGSAVNPDTGEKDISKYIKIKYYDDNKNTYEINDIISLLLKNKKIVLVGEFGTGKSRCLMEVFDALIKINNSFYPIAINLRDHWGHKRLSDIIRNHLSQLGLENISDSLIRSLNRGNHILLLDGMDEIASQSWSGNPERLREIRKISLEGVRDIVNKCIKSGILITGREHYFSSDEEMYDCLGLKNSNEVIKLKCPDEFNEQEIINYIKENTNFDFVPEWIPKKPLICQLLAKLEPLEVKKYSNESTGEVIFFEYIFDAICERETRINPAVYKDELKNILIYLAHNTRKLPQDRELITIKDINEAFFVVTGHSPVDESSALLQRLPYLGRVGSGGSERIFIDDYARNGLRGLELSRILNSKDERVIHEKWLQPIEGFGLSILAKNVNDNNKLNNFIKLCSNHGNYQIACDYVVFRLYLDEDVYDFHRLNILSGVIDNIVLNNKIINIDIKNVYIKNLNIDSPSFEYVSFADCVIENVIGIGSESRMPSVFTNCIFNNFKGAFTISRISELQITDNQKTLLAIIKKLFFQPGSGRQEGALMRGTENYWNPDKAKEILHYMISNDIIIKTQGNHGFLYIPRKKYTQRMAKILEMQNNCSDDLWKMC